MKLVDPSVEIITEQNPLKRIELCGRVCYKSEDRITATSAVAFVKRMIRSGHTSVLEHARIKIDAQANYDEYRAIFATSIPAYRLRCYYGNNSAFPLYITVNVRDFIAAVPDANVYSIADHDLDLEYYTVRFICDRAIANELVRHRVFSFSQESTRYVSYREGVTFVRPFPFAWADCTNQDELTFKHYGMWYNAMASAEIAYRSMCATGLTPQEARDVLPLSTKTELVMTGQAYQWREMLKLRLAPSAHPQMVYLMKKLVEKIPAIEP